MTKPVVPRYLLLPFVLITSLFALWGFANAVTDPMVTAFKKVLELNNLKASMVQMAFYGGYFTMAIPAALLIRKYTYKTGIIVGLILYALGALLFYPAAVMQEFSLFLAGLYILTFGLAFLETTANPYVLSMGDPETATQRLNLAQAFNPVGLLGGLLVAQQFVLRKLQSDDLDFSSLSASAKESVRQADLSVIRDPYVLLGMVVLAVLVLILINKMPEKKERAHKLSFWQTIAKLLSDKKYAGGVITQVFYVGAQIMVWTYIYQYAEGIGMNAETAGNYQFIAFVVFFLGRFICTFLLKYISSGRLLMYLAIVGILCVSGVIVSTSIVGLYFLVASSFAMSLMFPTIYGIALDGLTEDEAKIGAAGLVMAIVGGALLPAIQGAILDIGGVGLNDITYFGLPEINLSFLLPLICFIMIALYGSRVYKVYKI